MYSRTIVKALSSLQKVPKNGIIKRTLIHGYDDSKRMALIVDDNIPQDLDNFVKNQDFKKEEINVGITMSDKLVAKLEKRKDNMIKRYDHFIFGNICFGYTFTMTVLTTNYYIETPSIFPWITFVTFPLAFISSKVGLNYVKRSISNTELESAKTINHILKSDNIVKDSYDI